MKTDFAKIYNFYSLDWAKGPYSPHKLAMTLALRTDGCMMTPYYSTMQLTTNNSSNLGQHSATRPPYRRESMAMQHPSLGQVRRDII